MSIRINCNRNRHALLCNFCFFVDVVLRIKTRNDRIRRRMEMTATRTLEEIISKHIECI